MTGPALPLCLVGLGGACATCASACIASSGFPIWKMFQQYVATDSVNIHNAKFLEDDCFSETLCNFATLYIVASQQKYKKEIFIWCT